MTTDSKHADPIAPNRLARQFDVHGVAINQVWVGDITYILLDLATVLDPGSRRCVGWAMRNTMEVELVTSSSSTFTTRPTADRENGSTLTPPTTSLSD